MITVIVLLQEILTICAEQMQQSIKSKNKKVWDDFALL
jgi:hypothetical protein